MENKPYDIPFLGCRKEKIEHANPELNENNFRMFVYWIKERYSIHIKKDLMKLPPPWTNDPILQTVRFTNVRREHDKESRYLIENCCENPYLTYRDKIANIFLFRMLNKAESVEGIFPVRFSEYDPAKIGDWANSLPKNFKQFKKVFMVSGMMGNINLLIGKRESGIQSCADYCKYLWDNGTFESLLGCFDAESIFNKISSIRGIGEFMAYQIFVDMTYCPECLVSENEFVVAGPGCKEGLKLLFNEKDGLSPEELLFWLRDNWENECTQFGIEWSPCNIFIDLPESEWHMNVMSIENCCCEISKYYRAWNGGFVTRKYKGGTI